MQRPEIVKQIKEKMMKTEPTATTILYGSEARGDARPDSDIDLLILLEGDKRDLRKESEISGALYDIELESGILISPMIMLRKHSLLSKESHFNAAINRLYYACFYAASALMVAYGLTASSHAGVKTMIGMHFVSKGLLSNEQGKAFSRLFEIRHSGDYDDFVMTRTRSCHHNVPYKNKTTRRFKHCEEAWRVLVVQR